MIIEYIGYAIDSSRNDKLDEAYRRAGALLDASPHCQVTAKARQLASRARRRVQGAPVPDVDLDRQREVADACLAAARHGDFDGLLAVLDPDVVLRAHGPAGAGEVRGAPAVAERALMFAHLAPSARPALVNGAVGFVVSREGRPASIVGVIVRGGKIVEVDVVADPIAFRSSTSRFSTDEGLPPRARCYSMRTPPLLHP